MHSSDKHPHAIAAGSKNGQLHSPPDKEEGHHEHISEDKYKVLKRKLREMIELNESISKDYVKAKKKVRLLTLERDVLLENIARIGEHEQRSSPRSLGDDQTGLHYLRESTSDTDEDNVLAISSSNGTSSGDSISSSNSSISSRSKGAMTNTAKRLLLPPSRQRLRRQRPAQHPSHTHLRRSGEIAPQNQRHKDITTVSSAPPKRSKMNRSTPIKVRRVQPVDRDETGMVKLPQQIGVLTVVNLGKIIHDRDTFHNERYIFPVGFAVQRTYPSMTDPTKNTVIVSTILDGGDGPLFHVVAEDMPNEPIIASSATGAWTVVVRRSNEIRHREHSNSASGPDYYGFKHPTIAKLIQDLPGTEKLKYYVRQNFEEMEPRAAKGVMAAALKKRGNLEQMGNANMRAPKIASRRLHKQKEEEDEEEEEEDKDPVSKSISITSPLLLGADCGDNNNIEIEELHSENDK